MVGMGTLVNTAAVLAGGLIGLAAGRGLPERFRQTITWTLGLITVFLAVGLMTSIAMGYALQVVGAILAGAIVGELLRIEQGLAWLGERLRQRFAPKRDGEPATFVEGFVVASLIFCIGPMTLMGTFDDGLGQPPTLLYVKSAMDGVLAIALAASLGRGVLFSALFVLLFQGLLTATWWFVQSQLPEHFQITGLYLNGLRATGGVLILAIGLMLLELRRIRVANLLPALPLVCLILWLWPKAL